MSLSMNDYDGLLDRALSKITQSTGTGERFELPIAMVQIIGQRTIVVNFSDVVDRLNRDPHHVLKYLAKEMATAGSYEGGRGYFQGRFSRESKFYGSAVVGVSQALVMMNGAEMLTLVGRRIVDAAIANGLVHLDADITIAAVPHVQVMKL